MKFQDLIAYWEATHRFPVPNGRSHAGVRWKVVLFLFIMAMREGWCDMDLLLDPFFMHFPQRANDVLWYLSIEARRANLVDPMLNRREQITLIEALEECDEADPWRTHF
ncbi:hypothetical protein PHMEG_00016621 [Phytophthora megakarya]|uniref:Uncharacterized protein n=1 Tax=Phytophthora megakarya TaxID=4795 RepID=A0A225VYU7_9STRA|nr:hypothetical protein PHMEG_00016621 [Phytophthora megakarya]